jgi:predicted enzyme related to lactoylglutathione lyase
MQVLINIDVDDLEKAIGFYGTAFGLEVGRGFQHYPAAPQL